MARNKKQSGFTIIEVVLVLAIAGLIFLMVFIALPALQRGQRNTQRKNDLSRFVTAASQYQANNSNRLPFAKSALSDAEIDSEGMTADNSAFIKRYIIAGGDTGQFEDSDGRPNRLYVNWRGNGISGADKTTGTAACKDATGCEFDAYGSKDGFGSDSDKEKRNIYTSINAKCAEQEGYIKYSPGQNDFALVMFLEGNSIACADNQ